jgi:hypothetical protein
VTAVSGSGRDAPAGAVRVDAVVSHLLDPYRSGVARFNAELAARLGVPLYGLCAPEAAACRAVLLSIKVSELGAEEVAAVERLLDTTEPSGIRLFLHERSGSALEERLVRAAGWVLCGNEEVFAAVEALTERASCLWSPSTLSDLRTYPQVETRLFSFGMAHKVRTDKFRRLKQLLDHDGRSYALYVSNANHEAAEMTDQRAIAEEMREIFGSRLFFLGHLSDVAVANELRSATLFAAFFERGARANNSTVVTAMEHGAVVITNLDEHSPPYLRHLETVIDIDRIDELPVDQLTLRRIGVNAMEASLALGWDPFIADVRRHVSRD